MPRIWCGSDEKLERTARLNGMLGRVISHYQIEAELGRGGMGVVYRAQDMTLPRSVALKFLHPHLSADENVKRRFIHEAESACRLDHPNICTIYEIGETDDGQMFIVMAYYEGETIRKKIDNGNIPLEDVFSYIKQASQGLQEAHKLRLAHRDINPSNLIVNSAGVLKILDFGIAKEIGGAQFTVGGGGLGTLGYMSPEQIRGEADIDHRTDIWALGVVFYELLTGNVPFGGDYREVIAYSILNDKPRSLRAFRGELPRRLDWTVRSKMLAKKRAYRFQSAGDLLVELEALREHCAEAERREAESKTQPVKNLRVTRATGRTTGRGLPSVRRAIWAPAAAAAAASLLLLPALVPSVRAHLTGIVCSVVPALYSPCQIPDFRHVTVQPFETAGDSSGRPFAAGLAEQAAIELGHLTQFHDALCVHPPRDGAPEIGTNLVLSGTVERQGEFVRVDANLEVPPAGPVVRKFSINVRANDLPELQDDLINRLAALLELGVDSDAKAGWLAGGTAIPEAYEAYLAGLGNLRLGDVPMAIEAFEGALKLDPFYPRAYVGLGDALRTRYEETSEALWLERASAAYKTALQHSSELPRAHYGLGILEAGTGKYKEAINCFRAALELDPVNAGIRQRLVLAYEVHARNEEAEALLADAAAERPNCWVRHNDLGLLLRKHGAYEQARERFERVIQLSPENYIGYTNLAAALLHMDRFEEAEAPLRRSIEILPRASAYSNLAYSYYHQRKFSEAVDVLEKAIALDPRNFRAWSNLGEILLMVPELENRASGAFHRAIRIAESELENDPREAELLATLASAWAQLSRRHEMLRATAEAAEARGKALEAIEKAISYAPRNINVLFRASLVYELVGMRDQALENLRAALEAGFSLTEIGNSSVLEDLRKDPRYPGILPKPQPIGGATEGHNR